MLELIIVGIIVAAALAWTIRQLFFQGRNKSKGSCCSSGGNDKKACAGCQAMPGINTVKQLSRKV